MNLFYGSSFSQRLIHNEMAVAGRNSKFIQEFPAAQIIVIPGKTQPVPAGFKTADGLLEGFLVCLSDTHDLAYSPHLCAEFILYTFKFLKSPAGEFDYYIIPVRNIFIQCAVFAAGNVLQSQSGCQHRGYKSNGKAGGLGRQSRGTGGSWIDFNYNNAVADRIVCKLYIRSADNLNRFYDTVSLLLQPFLDVF